MQEDSENNKRHQFDSSWLKFSAPLLPLTDESCLAPLTHIIEETFDTPLKLLAAKTHFAAFSADLSAVKIQLSTNSLLCFVKTTRAESSDLFRLIVDSFHAERQSGYTVLVIVDGSQEALKSRFENYAARILFLSKKQLQQILLSSSWVAALAEQLRIAELRLDILSPYNENGVYYPRRKHG